MSVDRKTLNLLVCPLCKSGISYQRKEEELVCVACGLAFPVRNGIPVMLEEEAREISLEEKEQLKKKG